MSDLLEKGTQIIYVPDHVNGDVDHSHCETGFVARDTRVTGRKYDTVFCRYWSKSSPGELRTKANSELSYVSMLIVQDTVSQKDVEDTILRWDVC